MQHCVRANKQRNFCNLLPLQLNTNLHIPDFELILAIGNNYFEFL